LEAALPTAGRYAQRAFGEAFPFREGDRIRTGDVQLGKTACFSAHLPGIRFSYGGFTTFRGACKVVRSLRGAAWICGRFQ
jgi:hypothetical protein